MRRRFTVSLCREGDWMIVQCLKVDVASQGESEAEALANLEEALALHFMEPTPTVPSRLATIAVEVASA